MLYSLALKVAQRFPNASRVLFGTDASLPNVVKGYSALRNHRRQAPVAPTRKYQEIAARMDRVGYALLGQPYDAHFLERIADTFDALTSDDGVWKFRYESSGSVHDEDQRTMQESGRGSMVQRDLVDPLKHLPELRALVDAETVNMLETCYGTHFRLVRVGYWRNYHVPPVFSEKEEVGYSHYWHHDGHGIDTLKLFIAMTDVTEADGPFHVLSKSESRRLVRRRFQRDQAKHDDLSSLKPFLLTGPRGTTAVCNTTLCLHRAGIPAPGRHRDLLQFQFVSAATPYAR